jgi:hypothetical protein
MRTRDVHGHRRRQTLRAATPRHRPRAFPPMRTGQVHSSGRRACQHPLAWIVQHDELGRQTDSLECKREKRLRDTHRRRRQTAPLAGVAPCRRPPARLTGVCRPGDGTVHSPRCRSRVASKADRRTALGGTDGEEEGTGLMRQTSMRYLMRARYMTVSECSWKRRAVAGPKHQVQGKEACLPAARNHGSLSPE